MTDMDDVKVSIKDANGNVVWLAQLTADEAKQCREASWHLTGKI